MAAPGVVIWVDKAFAASARAGAKLSKHQREVIAFADAHGVVKCATTDDCVRMVRTTLAAGEASRVAVVTNMRRAESQTAGLDLHAAVAHDPRVAPFVLYTTTTPGELPDGISVVSTIEGVQSALASYV
eukprot:Rhum_TRINITY_DN8744_c0_g2::Rhum_TRINITY_DN8744_c0_g2_i1::g.29454::m.29454